MLDLDLIRNLSFVVVVVPWEIVRDEPQRSAGHAPERHLHLRFYNTSSIGKMEITFSYTVCACCCSSLSWSTQSPDPPTLSAVANIARYTPILPQVTLHNVWVHPTWSETHTAEATSRCCHSICSPNTSHQRVQGWPQRCV